MISPDIDMNTPLQQQSKPMQVAKITLLGTAFIGLGAVLSVYVPACKKPVDLIEQNYLKGCKALSSVPVVGVVFKDNPLIEHQGVSRFLAVSAFETVLASGASIAGGALMKLFGHLPKDKERELLANPSQGRGRE